LFSSTDVDAVVDEITRKEPLITASKIEQVRKLIISILDCVRVSGVISLSASKIS